MRPNSPAPSWNCGNGLTTCGRNWTATWQANTTSRTKDQKAYGQWRGSHQPFHWFVEFYGIMHDGGFDVIIGNPPYVAVQRR